MSGFTGSGASLDARAVRPKMQRRPGATYGTKARRIARPSSQTAEPSVATVTGSKTDAKSDDEDDEVKVRKSVQDFETGENTGRP